MRRTGELTDRASRRGRRPVERATVRRVTESGVRVTLDREGDRREVEVDYEPQVQLDPSSDPEDSASQLVAVDPPEGTRCVVLFPDRAGGRGVAVWLGRYADVEA